MWIPPLCLLLLLGGDPEPPFDVRPAVALAEARLDAARDEPARRTEHLRAALARLEEAAARSPLAPRPFELLARVLLGLNRPRDAARAGRRAVELAPAEPRAHLALGGALLRLGEDEDAERRLGDALAREPAPAERAEAHRLRARARLRLGAIERAHDDARRAADIEPSNHDGEALLRWCAARRRAPLAGAARTPAGRFEVRSEIGAEAAAAAAGDLALLERALGDVLPLEDAAGAPLLSGRAVPVYLVAEGAFLALAPPGQEASAFYQRDEMAVFVRARGAEEMRRLVRHEATHAHVQRAVEEAPAWLDEGLADVLAADPHPVRLRDLRALVGSGHDLALRDLALLDRRVLYEPPAVQSRFAAAWGWVHFLRARHPERLRRCVAAVRGGGSAAEAFAAAFGDLADLAPLEREWRDYVLSLKP